MSDELDFAFDKTTCVMGSTNVTVDQGGSGGSDALRPMAIRCVVSPPKRGVCCSTWRRCISACPSPRWTVSDGVVAVRGATPPRTVTYGELIGGKKFSVTLTGRNIDATTGVAKLKPVQEMKNVGKSPQRDDIPRKVDGSGKWAVDAKVPGMVHARNVKPPVAGATLVSVDESSVQKPSGLRSCRPQGQLSGCRLRARRAGPSGRESIEGPSGGSRPARRSPPHPEFFGYLRRTQPAFHAGRPHVTGNVEAAFAGAAKVVEADYDIPFQGHTSIGPAHAMADPSEQSADDLFQRHEVVRPAQRRRAVPQHPA
jgi:hypothetical protein